MVMTVSGKLIYAYAYLAFLLAMTLSDVRLQLAQEDEARGIAGFSGGEETSASSFLLLGLDIERLQ